MSDHYSIDFMTDEDGWWPGLCNCGANLGTFPTAEDACDALMDHAYAAGVASDVTEGLPPDLVRAFRDPTIIIDRDHEIVLADGRSLFEHLREWRDAPSNTASASFPARGEASLSPKSALTDSSPASAPDLAATSTQSGASPEGNEGETGADKSSPAIHLDTEGGTTRQGTAQAASVGSADGGASPQSEVGVESSGEVHEKVGGRATGRSAEVPASPESSPATSSEREPGRGVDASTSDATSPAGTDTGASSRSEEPLVTNDNLASRVHHAQKLLERGDETEIISWLLGVSYDDVRRVSNPASEPNAICPSCGGDAGDNWFDRSLCSEGDMHTRCTNCGFALDGCGDDSPATSDPFTGEPGPEDVSMYVEPDPATQPDVSEGVDVRPQGPLTSGNPSVGEAPSETSDPASRPRLVQCLYCNKTHAVVDGDTPCGGLDSNWIDASVPASRSDVSEPDTETATESVNSRVASGDAGSFSGSETFDPASTPEERFADADLEFNRANEWTPDPASKPKEG